MRNFGFLRYGEMVVEGQECLLFARRSTHAATQSSGLTTLSPCTLVATCR